MALDSERQISYNKQYLTNLLWSKIISEVTIDRLRYIQDKARAVPEMVNSLEKYHMTRPESFVRGLEHGRAWKRLIDKEKLVKDERRIVLALFNELTPHVMHYEFFLPCFELQASDEQKAKWLGKLENLEYIGCYAQTELGHGSNVRGIEIEARYDHANKLFVFHSPTITATKWWVGGLGLGSTHALIVARLILNGSDYGPNAFFIQIRDLNTHEPLEGVEVGDIGPKMGVNLNDNGFLRFDHFKQPKEVMLNRFARINESGEYEVIDTNAIKILYLSLIKARSTIVQDAWFPLTCALTISIRYSLVRRQFEDPDNKTQERKILEYQAQKFKLFRVLSRLYCFIFVRPFMKQMYQTAEEKLKKGDDSDLPSLHGIISLYKSYITFDTLDGLEECRRSCGGHGFLMSSGLPSLYLDYLPAITYDGDNSILALQAARFLAGVVKKTKDVHESLLYLSSRPQTPEGEAHSADFHQKCFELAARQKFARLLQKEQVLTKNKKKSVVWNQDLQIEAIQAAEAAFYASVHRFFSLGIEAITDVGVKNVIENMRQLYATCELEKFHSELLRGGVASSTIQKLKEVQLESLEKIRPDALGLIEAFELTDDCLNTVIGNKDGIVYERMLETAKTKNPLNKNKVFPGLVQTLRPKL